ncbi:hypothetical protein GCM10023258_24540 [Terrabacter aeriphilus]|uniref:DUF222 domain-containing protein n=1 Tax=Terrabacter aeriphilus TaxID=515662 RepID=A0ABP9JE12_9MICO
MARTSASEATREVSPGAALEVLTGIPAAVFDALPLTAQAAVVARIVPEAVRTLDQSCAEAVLVVTQRAVNALDALQELALAALVRGEEIDCSDLADDGGDGSEYRPSSVKLVASSVAPLLRATPRACEAHVVRALCLADDLPRTVALALEGQLDRRQADVVVDHAQLVAVPARTIFDAAVTCDPDVTSLTPHWLRRVCERAALAVDPAAMERRAQLGLRDRFVRVEPGTDPGIAWWRASLPSMQSAQAWAAVDEIAHEYVRADPGLTIDQARADALVDLLLGRAGVTTTVELILPAFVGDAGASSAPGSAADDGVTSGAGVVASPEVAPGPADPDVDRVTLPEAFRRSERTASRIAESASSWLTGHGLEHVAGAPFASEQALASELFGPAGLVDGEPPPPLPADTLAHVLMLHEHESRRRGWEQLAARMLAEHGLHLGRWRPPELGVRDPRGGWILTEALVAVLTDPDVVLRLSRADARTGVTSAREPSRYRPNAALARAGAGPRPAEPLPHAPRLQAPRRLDARPVAHGGLHLDLADRTHVRHAPGRRPAGCCVSPRSMFRGSRWSGESWAGGVVGRGSRGAAQSTSPGVRESAFPWAAAPPLESQVGPLARC